jgi:hypothetical protein
LRWIPACGKFQWESRAESSSSTQPKSQAARPIAFLTFQIRKKLFEKKGEMSTYLLFLLIVGVFVTFMVLTVQNAQSTAQQFSTINQALYATQQELQATQAELNTLKLNTFNSSIALIQNGTLWLFLSNNLNTFDTRNPFSTAINYQQTTYRLMVVQLANEETTFNVLEIDPPSTPLTVTSYEGSGSLTITAQLLDPASDIFTAVGAAYGVYPGYLDSSDPVFSPLSSENAKQLQIQPDCFASGECQENMQYWTSYWAPYTGYKAPAPNTILFGVDSYGNPNSGMFWMMIIDTTSETNYDFTGSQLTFESGLKLILPVV